MNLKHLPIFGLAIAAMFSSCTIQKRTAMPGYHVDWKSNKTAAHNNAEDSKVEKINVNETFAVKNETTVQNATTIAAVKEIASESAVAEATQDRVSNKTEQVSAVSAVKQVKTIAKAKSATQKEQVKAAKTSLKQQLNQRGGGDVPLVLLYILCIIIPFVAVGLVTDWELKPVLINLLLCLLCGIPGIIHAFIVVSRNR